MSSQNPDHSLLERRLRREKAARQNAEQLLNEKSIELYQALQSSQQIQKSLEMALWASQESFWEWRASDDTITFRSFDLEEKNANEWQAAPSKVVDSVHPDDMQRLQQQWARLRQTDKDSIETVFRYRSKARYLWMRMRGRVLSFDQEGLPEYVVGTTKDITRQRVAEQSFHLMASAFSSSREPMLVMTEDLDITECNDAFLALYRRYQREEVEGLRLADLLVGEVDTSMLNGNRPIHVECEFQTYEKETRPVELSVSRFQDRDQDSVYLIATLRDISERREHEANLRHMALNDALTGLLNRNGLREQMTQYVNDGRPFFVAFIDLDGFKQVNDIAGHDEGDACLRQIAELLAGHFCEHSVVTRWGGDEFVVLLPAVSSTHAYDSCTRAIKQIESHPISTAGGELALSASVGLASFPQHGNDVETLLQKSDAAMYQAKTTGKGKVFEYLHGLTDSMKAKVSMLSDFKRAVLNHGLDFYIQGKYDKAGRLHGGELLCRWRSALHGMVSPGVFIPMAEEHGLDSDIGLQALDAACDYINMFGQTYQHVTMAINISANQLLDPQFPQQAKDICEQNDVDPNHIEIEITESIFMVNERGAMAALHQLKDIGFTLALDDFGTGYSSLSYLRSFHFDVVKLDRSLIKDVNNDVKALALVQGVAAMLDSLEVIIIAEGIENPDYLPLLEDAGIDLFQGFYFDNPCPYEQFAAKHTREFKAAQ